MEIALRSPIKGVVLLSYGCGNIPDDREDLLAALKEASERGVVIVNISHCKTGRVIDSYHCGAIFE